MARPDERVGRTHEAERVSAAGEGCGTRRDRLAVYFGWRPGRRPRPAPDLAYRPAQRGLAWRMAAPPRRGARARPQDDATPAGNIPTANHPRSLQGVGAQTAPQRRIQRRPSPKQQKIILMGHLQH